MSTGGCAVSTTPASTSAALASGALLLALVLSRRRARLTLR